jgi:serine/threonine protein kinase
MNCPSCQQVLNDAARFCSNCGLSTASFNSETGNIEPQTLRYSKPPDPLIGRILDGKYEVIERLGEGGMGAVYRARRLHIGDEVAVKVLHSDLVVNDRAIERFRREARSAAFISHPNVVSIHDFSDAQSSETPAYIVMELVRGTSLRNLLEREGRLPPARAVRLMQDICAGVGVAHRQGVVHRDLKPDNIIIAAASHEGERETAKVVDFGIAKLRDMAAESGLTQPGAVMGTIYYMSPEQCRGEELDARADVYSLGAMLYEMLTGHPPFRANNVAGLISKHVAEAPPTFPHKLEIPPGLAATCYKALAKNRDERQADAVILGREFQHAFAPAAPQTLRSATAPPTARSNWLSWAIGGLAILFLFVVLASVAGIFIYNKSVAKDSNTARETPEKPNSSAQRDDQSPPDDSTTADVKDLRGTWSGTYGPTGQPATMIIRKQTDQSFEGILQQGDARVSFSGKIDPKTLHLSIKQAEVLSGSWSLGEDEGKLSEDGRKMSGTGKDAIGGPFGISYQWSFSR